MKDESEKNMLNKRRLVLRVILYVASLFLLISISAWFVLAYFSQTIEDSFAKIYKTQAQAVGEAIGAQFFERYGDVQAMAAASALISSTGNDRPKIENLLNSYSRLYRLYDFIMVVDTQGNVLATNTQGIAGAKRQPIAETKTAILNASWFSKPLSRKFTEDTSKNLTGTYFEIDKKNQRAIFSALILKNNSPVGVIVAYSRLDWVTQAVREQYNRFLNLGMSGTATYVVDDKDQVLSSYGVRDSTLKESANNNITVKENIDGSRFPLGLNWKIIIQSPRSDIRYVIQYWKLYYIFFGCFLFGAIAAVIAYFGRQFTLLSKAHEKAVAEHSTLQGKVTEQTNALEESVQELKIMQERVESQEKLAGLGVMAAGLAHEIKNPLNIVINSSQYLKDYYMENAATGDVDEARKFADMIVRQGERIDALVKAILLSARRDTEENRVIVDVSALVKESLQICLKTFQIQNQVSVPTNLISSATPVKVKVDIEDLRRTILNLIDNALYSLLKRWGKENMANASLKLQIEKKDAMVVIMVEDNGIGISEKDAKNIFTPFFTTKERGQGTGLGLSMCSDLMKKYGGAIYFESEQNKYCRFFVKLPEHVQ